MKTQIEVPFSMSAQVGDRTIEDAVSGAISVNLYHDPEEDEINAWRTPPGRPALALPYGMSGQMERAAIEEARRMHQADLGEAKIASAE